MQKYNALKPRQQEYIRRFFTGLLIENEDENIEVHGEYTRAFLRYMSSKHCDMEWAPAWIVKDVSRRDDSKKGHYFIPELFEYHEQIQDAEMTDEEAIQSGSYAAYGSPV